MSPQFYMARDNLFQTLMGGHGENDAITEHVWSSLVQGKEDNVENAM